MVRLSRVNCAEIRMIIGQVRVRFLYTRIRFLKLNSSW